MQHLVVTLIMITLSHTKTAVRMKKEKMLATSDILVLLYVKALLD